MMPTERPRPSDGSPPTPQLAGPDEVVLRRAVRGDADAFAQLVHREEPRLRALAYHLLRDPDRTDDALQEAYVRAFRALADFRVEASFGTWMYRITHNVCMDELRRCPPVASLDHLDRERPDPRPDPSTDVVDRADLAAAFAALPPEHRAVVLAVDVHGLNYEEAADALGIPSGTVGSRLNRARASLRRTLEARG